MADRWGRDSALGIATRYGLDGPGSNPDGGVQTGSGAHPSSYTIGTGSCPGVKRPGRGVTTHPHLRPRFKEE